MQPQFTYFLILILSIAGPLALSFDKKVAFYKDWKYVVIALLIPAVFFIIWDIIFTKMGVWSFNENYVTGINISSIPIEEAMFFLVVPYCCLFIYACVRSYFPTLQNNPISSKILLGLAIVLLISSVIFYDKYYTAFTFLFTGIFILVINFAKNYFKAFNKTAFLISYLIILIPFMAVNGILTSWPVVIYNNSENLNLRIFTIPFEDVFYGMLLIMMNVVIYERLKTSSNTSSK